MIRYFVAGFFLLQIQVSYASQSNLLQLSRNERMGLIGQVAVIQLYKNESNKNPVRSVGQRPGARYRVSCIRCSSTLKQQKISPLH